MSKESSLSAPPVDLADQFDRMVAYPHAAYDILRNRNDVELDRYWVSRRVAFLLYIGVQDERDASIIASSELHTAYLGEICLCSDLILRNRDALIKSHSSFA